MSALIVRLPGLWLRALLLFTAFAAASPVLASSQCSEPVESRGVALVIGNSSYSGTTWQPLKNAVNDALLVCDALHQRGFSVLLGLDLDRAGLTEIVAEFADRAKGSEVAIVYVASHGFSFGGNSYIVPINIAANVTLEELTGEHVTSRSLQNAAAGSRRPMVVIDACTVFFNPSQLTITLADGQTRSARSIDPNGSYVEDDLDRGFDYGFEQGQAGMTVWVAGSNGYAYDDTGDQPDNGPAALAFSQAIGFAEDLQEIGLHMRRYMSEAYQKDGIEIVGGRFIFTYGTLDEFGLPVP